MSNFRTARGIEDDHLSQSSDEKMDTGSESYRSQDTPNSTLSSDFEDKSETNVLRLQNPEEELPEMDNHNIPKKRLEELSDSFLTKMSKLHLDSPIENRPKNLALTDRNLGISPPKFSSTLVLTTDHPLMVTSPDSYSDLIPKKVTKDEDKDLSLSSIEDERPLETNGYDFYSPHMNTSKNNLYFSENFLTADSNGLSDSSRDMAPDVAKVKDQRRKIIPRFVDTPPRLDNRRSEDRPRMVLGRIVDGNTDENAITKYIEERNKKLDSHSTPKVTVEDYLNSRENSFNEWCESYKRAAPKFELPIEPSSNNIPAANELGSPDVLSTSSQDDKSAYQALLDPYTGSVALRPRQKHLDTSRRRKIQLPPEDDDQCSSDSGSIALDSEEPDPLDDLEVDDQPQDKNSDDDNHRSKSTNTCSECSEPIPEYSAAEERHNERSYLSVRTGDTHTTCDMKVIEPYKRVLSHGGYDASGAALIVFSACHLPDTARPDYRYVMDNLFLYIVWSLERLIGSEYVLVYLHGSAGARRLPSIRWLHETYRLIDRRLRKSLKHLYLVHPTFWLKSFVVLTKPFVSWKFLRKFSYVNSLEELQRLVPVEPNAIPDIVREFDKRR